MRQTIAQLDSALPGMKLRDTSITLPGEKAPRHASLWLQDSIPRKLTVAEPNEHGDMTEESSYWFVDDELRAALQPFDGYFFEADRMLLWTDGTLVPRPNISTEDRMAKELEVLAEVRAWMGRFGVLMP